MPAQNVTPQTIQSLATSISEAAQSADVQLKALKGQPVNVVLGVNESSDVDVTKSMSDFINDAKESTTVSTPSFFTSYGYRREEWESMSFLQTWNFFTYIDSTAGCENKCTKTTYHHAFRCTCCRSSWRNYYHVRPNSFLSFFILWSEKLMGLFAGNR